LPTLQLGLFREGVLCGLELFDAARIVLTFLRQRAGFAHRARESKRKARALSRMSATVAKLQQDEAFAPRLRHKTLEHPAFQEERRS
jgi:hypothetical protein